MQRAAFLKTWTIQYLPCQELLSNKQKEQDFAMLFAGEGESAPTLILGTFYPFEWGLFCGYIKPKRCESNTSYKPSLISSFVYIIYLEEPTTTLPPFASLEPRMFYRSVKSSVQILIYVSKLWKGRSIHASILTEQKIFCLCLICSQRLNNFFVIRTLTRTFLFKGIIAQGSSYAPKTNCSQLRELLP